MSNTTLPHFRSPPQSSFRLEADFALQVVFVASLADSTFDSFDEGHSFYRLWLWLVVAGFC
jgi:hypothetical protein